MTRWHVFRKLAASFCDRVRQFFRGTWSSKHSDGLSWSEWLAPVIEVHDTPDKLLYEIELPGVERKDIDVNVHANLLTIRAERKRSHKDKEGELAVERKPVRLICDFIDDAGGGRPRVNSDLVCQWRSKH